MLDYDTLFAISMVQMLGRSSRAIRITTLTSNHYGQVLLQQLRDAGLIKIYPESSCCELQRELSGITLLDVMRAVHGHLQITPEARDGQSQDLTRIYGEAGIQLEKIRKSSRNMLASICLYDVWLATAQEQKEELASCESSILTPI
ncbi:MAG: Rrf2 family transcriptional regulator [Prevotellaceae bacterium]|jgi:DNA-binding IscR family transcriptional regulator|nr:Rrf2 family transcriptional regulator [Prevotellaceae bacterium]